MGWRREKVVNPAEPRQTGIAEEIFDAGILWITAKFDDSLSDDEDF